MADHTPYQQKIIKRWLQELRRHQVPGALPRLATDLYLAEGRSRDRLWLQVEESLRKLEFPRYRESPMCSRSLEPRVAGVGILKELEGSRGILASIRSLLGSRGAPRRPWTKMWSRADRVAALEYADDFASLFKRGPPAVQALSRWSAILARNSRPNARGPSAPWSRRSGPESARSARSSPWCSGGSAARSISPARSASSCGSIPYLTNPPSVPTIHQRGRSRRQTRLVST